MSFVRSIGGVRFLVTGPGPASPDGLRRAFTRPAVEGEEGDVLVETRPGRECVLPDGAPSFDSGGSWRLFSDGSGYLVTLAMGDRPDGCEERHLVARADGGTSRVTTFVPERLPGVDAIGYPLDQILLMNHLSQRDGLVVHSAGIVLDGVGLCLPGVSGAGKSTVTALFRDAAPDAILLSDDRTVVRRRAGEWEVWGTPWPGTLGVAANASARLGAVLVLKQATSHGVAPLGPCEAVRRLLPMVACPWYDAERFPLVLGTVERLVEAVPCFELGFSRDAGVVGVVRDLVASGIAGRVPTGR